ETLFRNLHRSLSGAEANDDCMLSGAETLFRNLHRSLSGAEANDFKVLQYVNSLTSEKRQS
ncbi:MAG: hypothetical protein ABJB16_16315, partial [Saprospiraceae bacterium]